MRVVSMSQSPGPRMTRVPQRMAHPVSSMCISGGGGGAGLVQGLRNCARPVSFTAFLAQNWVWCWQPRVPGALHSIIRLQQLCLLNAALKGRH